jgi:phosphoglycerate dehydrogenase-like enzyme
LSLALRATPYFPEVTGPFVAMGRTKEDASIGIIGMGDMGKMYAQRLSDAGWR